jgi:hypothetical protein
MANVDDVLTQLETLHNMAKGLVPDVAKQLAKMRNDLMRLKIDIDKLPTNLRAAAAKSLESIVNFIHPRADAFLKEMNFSKINQLKIDAQKAQEKIQQLMQNVAANLPQSTQSATQTKPAAPKPQKPAPQASKKQANPFNLLGNLFSGKTSSNPIAQAVYDLFKGIMALFQALFGGKKKATSNATSTRTAKPSTNSTTNPVANATPTPSPAPTPSPTFNADSKPAFTYQPPRKSFPVSGIVRTLSGNLIKTHLELDQQSDCVYGTFGHGTMNHDRYELAGLWNPHTGQQFVLRGQQSGRILEITDLEYNGKKVSGEELVEIIKSSYAARQYPKVKSLALANPEVIGTRPVMVDGQLMQEQYKTYKA